jgi:hypothetical protein
MRLKTQLVLGALQIVTATGAFTQEPTEPGWFCGSREALADHQIDRNGVRVNNFSLNERGALAGGGLTALEFTFSVANKQAKSVSLDAQLVGLSAAGKIVFGLRASPMMDMVSGNKTDQARGSIYVSPGDLAKSQTFCLRIVGGF